MDMRDVYLKAIDDREADSDKWFSRAMESLALAGRLSVWLLISATLNLVLVMVIAGMYLEMR